MDKLRKCWPKCPFLSLLPALRNHSQSPGGRPLACRAPSRRGRRGWAPLAALCSLPHLPSCPPRTKTTEAPGVCGAVNVYMNGWRAIMKAGRESAATEQGHPSRGLGVSRQERFRKVCCGPRGRCLWVRREQGWRLGPRGFHRARSAELLEARAADARGQWVGDEAGMAEGRVARVIISRGHCVSHVDSGLEWLQRGPALILG